MNKFNEIRPIVLGLAVRDGKLLVSEGFDKNKNQYFYRCLGGGIEFLEKSSEALKREFKEELDVDVRVGEFLGVSENVFVYQGKNAHEHVFFYRVELKDEDVRERYDILDDDAVAMWVDIDEFKNGEKILYPEEIFKYL